MKTLIFSFFILLGTPAFAASENVIGSDISGSFLRAMKGRHSAAGQLIDRSQCSVSLQIGAGRSSGFDVITISYDEFKLPVQLARSGSYSRSLEESREGYTTEIYSIGFGDAKQELHLTKIMPGLFVVRAKIEFRGRAADSSSCFVKL